MNLTKELEIAGYKAVVMPVEVGARRFVGHQSTTFYNPSRDEGMGSNPGAVQKKKKKKISGRHLGVMTWVWPGPLRVSEVQGRNTCYKKGFFSEDSLLSSSPMSFYLLSRNVRFYFLLDIGRCHHKLRDNVSSLTCGSHHVCLKRKRNVSKYYKGLERCRNNLSNIS